MLGTNIKKYIIVNQYTRFAQNLKEICLHVYIEIIMFLNTVNQNQPNVNVDGFYEINQRLFGWYVVKIQIKH